jgi:hypothetical protein
MPDMPARHTTVGMQVGNNHQPREYCHTLHFAGHALHTWPGSPRDSLKGSIRPPRKLCEPFGVDRCEAEFGPERHKRNEQRPRLDGPSKAEELQLLGLTSLVSLVTVRSRGEGQRTGTRLVF